jgi:hypothetical protein
MPEAMVFGPLPGIGLVSALHSLSTFETSGSTLVETPGSRATGMWGDGRCFQHHRGRTAYARRQHVRRERGITTTRPGIRPASAGPTKITSSATSSHSDLGVPFLRRAPAGRRSHQSGNRRPSRPGAASLDDARRFFGYPGCNPHLVDCLVDYSRYEGPMSR